MGLDRLLDSMVVGEVAGLEQETLLGRVGEVVRRDMGLRVITPSRGGPVHLRQDL